MRNISSDVRAKKPKLRAFITDAANIYDEEESGRINITNADLVSNSLSFSHSTSNSGEITVGAAIISGCNFTLWNDTGKFDGYNWTNTVVSIELVYDNVSVYMGYYYIVSHRETGKTIRIEALDAFKIMDIHMLYEVDISWPAPASDVLTAIANYSFTRGVTLEGIDDLSDIIIYDPKQDQMPLREAVSYIAQMCGKFATIRSTSISDLRIHFGWYDTSSAVDVGTTFSHDLRTDDITVSGVTVSDATEDNIETVGDDSGYVIEIADNPFITAENIANVASRLESVVGLTFRPGTFAIENNAAIEAGDAIIINTRDEKNITTLATTMTFKPFQLQESITADCEAEAGDIQLSLANYIRRVAREEVEKAGGGEGGGGGLSPDELYKNMRPGDWLVLPTAEENTVYALILIPSGISSRVGVMANAGTSGKALAEFGTVTGGSFSAIESHNLSYSSYTRKSQWQGNIDATIYNNKTHDGFCQVVVKITSDTHTIIGFDFGYSFGSTTRYDPGCVEIRQNLRGAGTFSSKDLMFVVSDQPEGLSKYASIPDEALVAIGKWNGLSAIGSSLITSTIQKINGETLNYSNSKNLLYAGVEAEGGSCTVNYSGCDKLVQFEKMDLSKATYATLNCENCTSLAYTKDISAVTRLSVNFKNCTSLRSVGKLSAQEVRTPNFEGCTSLMAVCIENSTVPNFKDCSSLRVVRITPKSGSYSLSFPGCISLERLETSTASGWLGGSINLSDCTAMSRQSIMLLFAEIPARSSATITLHANVYALLSDADKAVAENKGYTVVAATSA